MRRFNSEFMLNESLKVNRSKFLENDLGHLTKNKSKRKPTVNLIRFLEKACIIQHSCSKLTLENANFVIPSEHIAMIFPENTEHSSIRCKTYLAACLQQNTLYRLCVISSLLRGNERIRMIEISNEVQKVVPAGVNAVSAGRSFALYQLKS